MTTEINNYKLVCKSVHFFYNGTRTHATPQRGSPQILTLFCPHARVVNLHKESAVACGIQTWQWKVCFNLLNSPWSRIETLTHQPWDGSIIYDDTFRSSRSVYLRCMGWAFAVTAVAATASARSVPVASNCTLPTRPASCAPGYTPG